MLPIVVRVDSSALIFVFLALFWAGYVLPRALKRHDEAALDDAVDSFSDTVRILRRPERTEARDRRSGGRAGGPAAGPAAGVETTPAVGAEPRPRVGGRLFARAAAGRPPAGRPPVGRAGDVVADVATTPEVAVRTAGPETAPGPAQHTTRVAARAAARRRRRVLLVLLGITATTVVLAAASVVSWSWTAFTFAAVVGWLVLCRVMVRQTVVAASTSRAHDDEARDDVVETSAPAPERASVSADELSDDGALWDPLPLTLPTYVSKPAARRTVRTIDLAGMTSSGHDAHDSALAREARAAEAAVSRPPAPAQTQRVVNG